MPPSAPYQIAPVALLSHLAQPRPLRPGKGAYRSRTGGPLHRSTYPQITPELGYRLAALADGEGCFSISRATQAERKRRRPGYRFVFTIKLRDDDREFLECFREATGLGTLSSARTVPTAGRPNTKPAVAWQIAAKADCLRLCEIFNQYGLWSRKAQQFGIWSRAISYWANPRITKGSDGRSVRDLIDWRPVEEAAEQLQRLKEYVA